MRILFINHHASAPEFGNPYRTYYLARELVKQGHAVTIVTAGFSHMREVQPDVKSKPVWQEIDGISYVFIPSRAYSNSSLYRLLNIFSFLFNYFRYWKTISERVKPEVVIEATTHILPIFISRRLARKHRALLVYEVRDLWPLSLIELSGISRYHPLALLIGLAQKAAIQSCDGVVSTLKFADEYFEEAVAKPRAYFHIQNGVVKSQFLLDSGVNSEPLNQLKDIKSKFRAVIGYAGTMGRANAVDILLDSASELADLDVAVVLIGRGEKRPELAQRAQTENLENVFVLEPVAKDQIVPIIRQFDLGFVGGKARNIHHYGVSPNKLFDYMASAVPVLFCVASPDDIVQDAGCGITINDPNVESIVREVAKFVEIPIGTRDDIGHRGRDYAMKNFEYGALAQRYVEAIQKMESGTSHNNQLGKATSP